MAANGFTHGSAAYVATLNNTGPRITHIYVIMFVITAH